MSAVMTHPLSKEFQAAMRHLPIALAHDDASAEVRERSVPPPSEIRLQSAVVAPDANVDPYADPPCTD
jgi:hypothetical protein